jgi:SlyX protein
MQPDHPAEQRITDLEIKASFTEDLLDQLNQIIVRQQQEIALLQRDVRELRLQASGDRPDLGSAAPRTAADELPPHY